MCECQYTFQGVLNQIGIEIFLIRLMTSFDTVNRTATLLVLKLFGFEIKDKLILTPYKSTPFIVNVQDKLEE